MSASVEAPLVDVRDLVRLFGDGAEAVRAVDGVSLAIARGETLGLVGESGCGKSTLGRTVLRLYTATGGEIYLDGRDITNLKGAALRQTRREMQMIFQDPLASLNPRMQVGAIIREPLREHKLSSRRDCEPRVRELFDLVALPLALRDRYPGELSGGQAQRVSIARALASNPRFIIADEAVSSLDVSVGAQIINLLDRLRTELDLSYLFISHNLSIVDHISDRVAVMYLGKIVELGPTEEIFETPLHPYTTALLSATPVADPRLSRSRERIILHGDPPSPRRPPMGCRFHTRCPIGPTVRQERTICAEVEPPLSERQPGHFAACHFPGEMSWTFTGE